MQALGKRMTEDLALNIGQGDSSVSYQLSDQILASPWGTMRGAILAWRTAQANGRAIGHAVSL